MRALVAGILDEKLAGTSSSSLSTSSSEEKSSSSDTLREDIREACGVVCLDGGGRCANIETDPSDVELLTVTARVRDGRGGDDDFAVTSLRTGGLDGRSGMSRSRGPSVVGPTTFSRAGSRGGKVSALTCGRLVDRFGL